jgi:hypothetical protein
MLIDGCNCLVLVNTVNQLLEEATRTQTEFFLTYACRCSKHCLAGVRRGSTSSGSRSFVKKRRVFPLMYSFGC